MPCTKIFWPNGLLKRSVCFEDGLRSGLDQIWNEQGVLVDVGSYEKGVAVGVHQRWNGSGLLIEEIVYLDSYRSTFRCWDDEGRLRVETFWLDKTNYLERAWDRFQNIWIEKKGTWDGQKIQFETKPLTLFSKPVLSPKILGDGWAIFQEKYPLLFLLSFEWRAEETAVEWIASLSLGNAECVYVYGIGCAGPYFQIQDWLHSNPNRKLIFLEDQSAHFAYFLNEPQSFEVVSDPQVHFEWIASKEAIASIVEQFPFEKVEVVAIPSKQGGDFQNLQLEVLRKTTLASAIYTDRMHGYLPFSHFLKNVNHIPTSFYANKLKDAFKGMPAIVCGAGPSLNQAILLLKQLSSKALIIAGGSTIAALSSQGVPIHFAMAIDPNLEEYRRMKNSFAFDTPFLYSTRLHPEVFKTCDGPFGYMRSGIGGILEVWLEEELGLIDPLIGVDLSPESISVTTICVAWAAFLGCSTIILSGVDLAYTNNKRYAEGVGVDEPFCKETFVEEKTAPHQVFRKTSDSNGLVDTAVRWVMEAESFSVFAKKNTNIHFINTSKDGLKIPSIPYMSLEDAAKKYLHQNCDYQTSIRQLIQDAKMPDETISLIQSKIEELKASLARVVSHLEVLSSGQEGLKAIAELELQEELAFDLLFYDTLDMLKKKQTVASNNLWKEFLVLAQKYMQTT